MTSRERLVAAWRCQEVDYVPITLDFAEDHKHPKAIWNDERQRLAFHLNREWDSTVGVSAQVTRLPDVRTRVSYETKGGKPVLHQIWQTPGGTIEERLLITPDWAVGGRDDDHPVEFSEDFRTARYVEFPFKTREDLNAIPYLFPPVNPADVDHMRRRRRQSKALADEFRVPLVAEVAAGLDWLLWLFPPEEIIVRAQLEPDFVHALLDRINGAYEDRLQILLEMGVDGVQRRGWYEGADFWSPHLFHDLAYGPLEREIRMTHNAGAVFIYIIDSGVLPLLGEFQSLALDCMYGVNPLGQPDNLRRMREALAGTSLWGGISGVFHLCEGTPDDVQRAVEQAFEYCGRRGFILGAIAGIRDYYPWKNIEAFERAWKRLRQENQ